MGYQLKVAGHKDTYDLKSLVAEGNYVQFSHYRAGNLWYSLHLNDMEWHHPGAELMLVAVPIADIGEATFPAQERAITFMRYIRKQLVLIEEAEKAKGQP